MTANHGEGMIYLTLANHRAGDFSVTRELIIHPGTVVSLSDAGAHCTRVIDASLPTFMMTHWVRDRHRGPKLPLSTIVKSCTLEPAAAYGLFDRGFVAEGYLADMNIIDFDNLRLPAPYLSFDSRRAVGDYSNGPRATWRRSRGFRSHSDTVSTPACFRAESYAVRNEHHVFSEPQGETG
jgi:N-acyl-D-amino-acid deacylase